MTKDQLLVFVSLFSHSRESFLRLEYLRLFGNEGTVAHFLHSSVDLFSRDDDDPWKKCIRALKPIRDQFDEGLITGEEAINVSFDALVQIVSSEELAKRAASIVEEQSSFAPIECKLCKTLFQPTLTSQTYCCEKCSPDKRRASVGRNQ